MSHIPTPTTRSAHAKGKRRLRRFLRRQFADEETRAQRWFDLIFVVLLSPAALVADRVFAADLHGTMGSPRGGPYLASLCLIVACVYVIHRWKGGGVRWPEAASAGVFAAGAFVSGGLGVALLPMSVWPIVSHSGRLGIAAPSILTIASSSGLLGLVPLMAGFSLARLTVRCIRRAGTTMENASTDGLAAAVALLAILVVAGQGRMATLVSRSHQRILIEDPAHPRSSKLLVRVLWVFPGVELEEIQDATLEVWRPEDEHRLEELHRELSGKPLPRRYR